MNSVGIRIIKLTRHTSSRSSSRANKCKAASTPPWRRRGRRQEGASHEQSILSTVIYFSIHHTRSCPEAKAKEVEITRNRLNEPFSATDARINLDLLWILYDIWNRPFFSYKHTHLYGVRRLRVGCVCVIHEEA